MRNLEFRALEIFKSHKFTVNGGKALIAYTHDAQSNETNSNLNSRISDLNINLSVRKVELKLLQTSNSFIRRVFVILLIQTFILLALTKYF